jgi:hypothetical protein
LAASFDVCFAAVVDEELELGALLDEDVGGDVPAVAGHQEAQFYLQM